MGGGTSCDGAGSLRLELELPPGQRFRARRTGFLVRAAGGVNDAGLLP
jgi:hypothetical protein